MWLRNTIIDGFSRLILLRLQNSPPNDEQVLGAMVNLWCETLETKFNLDEKQDKTRIEKAFLRLCGDCERFPSPKMLIDRMPARDLPLQLEKPKLTDEQIEKNKQRIRKMIAELKNATKP